MSVRVRLMTRGAANLAEAHDHVLEVAKNESTYRRQKYNAEDNYERKYE
jgi:hypothetical protein